MDGWTIGALFGVLGILVIVALAINAVFNAGLLYITVNFIVAERGTATFLRCLLCALGLVGAVIFAAIVAMLIPFFGFVAFLFVWLAASRAVIEASFELTEGAYQILIIYGLLNFLASYGMNAATGEGDIASLLLDDESASYEYAYEDDYESDYEHDYSYGEEDHDESDADEDAQEYSAEDAEIYAEQDADSEFSHTQSGPDPGLAEQAAAAENQPDTSRSHAGSAQAQPDQALPAQDPGPAGLNSMQPAQAAAEPNAPPPQPTATPTPVPINLPEVAGGLPPALASAGELPSRLRNGAFDGLAGWEPQHISKISDHAAMHTGANFLVWERSNSRGNLGLLGVRQDLTVDVSQAASAVLRLDVWVDSHAQPGIGENGYEGPLRAEIRYTDAAGAEQVFSWGFLVNTTASNASAVRKGAWTRFNINLMDDRIRKTPLGQPLPPPAMIKQIRLYGFGSDFKAAVGNVALLVN